jgi:serine/threonine protein kinase
MDNTSARGPKAEADDRANLSPGLVLQERYQIVRSLGNGGMGAVYEAVDLRLDTSVALKQAFSADPRLRKQFEQEARLLAQLHHPALPRVSDYFTEGERVFLVMQFIAGEDLAEIISKQPGPMPRNQVIAWADQLLDALVYLHTRDRQIIHRDIKPHNLKLTGNGRIALLDFGLAKAESDTTASSASIFGFTRRYSPPEQMQDQGTSPLSDIYALGATLYHLVTGIKPPDALVRTKAVGQSLDDPLQPANEIYPAVGPEVAAIIQRAMALNPEKRFQNADEFRDSLRRVGRDDVRAISNWSEVCTAEGSNVSSINVTVVSKPPTYDPFDSYSILKPIEMSWLVPKPNRRPLVIAAIFGLLLVGAVYAYANRDWIDVSKMAPGYVEASVGKPKNNSASNQKTFTPRANNLAGTNSGSAERRGSKRSRNPRRDENVSAQGKRVSQSPRAR